MLNLGKNGLKSALLASAATAVVMAVGAAPAAAQGTPAASEPTKVEKVTVTGSRIKQRDFKSTSPIATVGAKDLEMTGTVNVESLLNELPQVVPGLTITSNNPSLSGFATADLRGLGPGRTLILVNGRRANPSDRSGVVDLNTIPVSLIDRIELITGGASAVYGADAVAGAINFIMKDNFEGVQLSGNYSVAEDGAAPATSVDGAIGGSFDSGRGSLMAGFQYYYRQPVNAAARDWSRQTRAVGIDAAGNTFLTTGQLSAANTFNAAGSATPPWGFILPIGVAAPGFTIANITSATDPDGLGPLLGLTLDNDCGATPAIDPTLNASGFAGIRFNAAGGIEPFQNCAYASNNGQASPASNGDRYNFAPDNYLILENERVNAAVFGKYDIIGDDVLQAFVEASFTNTRSVQQLAATPVSPGVRVNVDLDPAVGPIVVNPYITANPQLLALVTATFPSLDNQAISYVTRPNQGGFRVGTAETNALGVTSGFRGTIPSLDWDWEVYHAFARNTTNIVNENNVGKTALTQLLNACNTTTLAVQPQPISALPNCPFPTKQGAAFVPTGNSNNPLGLNSMNADQLAFINVDTTDVTTYERNIVAGNMTGDLWDLWGAGPISAAIGFEYRDEQLIAKTDPFKQAGDIFGFNAQKSVNGQFDVYELYGETKIPLVTGVDLFEDLNIEAGYRVSDYSTGAGITQTWKYGANWSPTEGLTFRGIKNHAVRAPTAFELFQAGDQNFPGYGDPCNTAAINALAVGLRAARVATCTAWFAANGAVYPGYVLPGPNPVNFAQANSQVNAFQVGNVALNPEIADSLTYGVVFNPEWWPVGRLGVSVDRYEIQVQNLITRRSIANILNGCVNAGGVGGDCLLAPRLPDGQIQVVNQSLSNSANTQETKGVDVNFRWSSELEGIGLPGTLGVASFYTWVETFNNGGELVGTHDGTIGGGLPEHRATTNITYGIDDWSFLLRWSYTGEMEQLSFGTEKIQAYNLYEIGGTYEINNNLQLSFGVENVFDKQPQLFTDAQIFGQFNTDGSLYDQLGRSYRLGLTWKN